MSKIKSYKDLPGDVQNALYSPETGSKIRLIGSRYKLHVDQIGDLGDIIELVFLGDINIKDFPSEINSALKLSEEDTVSMIKDINTEIFEPIRESLMEIYGDTTPGKKSDLEEVINETKERAEMMNMIDNPEANMTQMKEIGEDKEVPTSVNHELPPSPPVLVPEKEEAPDNLPVAPVPPKAQTEPETPSVQEEVMEPELHEQKLGGVSKTPKVETTVGKKIGVTPIPDDVKKKINNDPYRESIE